MMTMLTRVALGFATLLSAAGQAQETQRNLVANGDFERALAYWQAVPPAVWEKDGGIDDSGALRMEASYAPEDGYIYQVTATQCIAIEDWSELRIEAWFRYDDELPEDPRGHRLNLIWFEDENCIQGGQFGDWLEPELEQGWQSLSKTGLVPALGSRYLKLEIAQDLRLSAIPRGGFESAISALFDTNPDLAAAYWDDISITAVRLKSLDPKPVAQAVPARDNYLMNPDFAAGPDHWEIDERKVTWVPGGAESRDGALRVELNSKLDSLGMDVFYQCVNVDPSLRYQARIRYLQGRGADKGGGRLRILWYAQANCRGSVGYGQHADIERGVGEWRELVIESIPVAPGALSAKFEVIQSVEANWSTNTILWDDAFFQRVVD